MEEEGREKGHLRKLLPVAQRPSNDVEKKMGFRKRWEKNMLSIKTLYSLVKCF